MPPPRQVKRSLAAALAIFARTPVPGRAKTRLIPLLGEVGAARFQGALLADVLRKARGLRVEASLSLFLVGRNSERAAAVKIPPQVALCRQRGATLGDRLESAFRKLFRHHERAVIIGTDSPLLPPGMIRLALRELNVCDAALGPCADGGYYLIGLRAARSSALLRGFLRDVRWSTRFAFRDTLASLTARGLSCSVLEAWDDVDRPGDVLRLRRWLGRHPAARRLAPATWRFLQASL
ncbi:MAG: TIGR04282 family arsenosugar biosynthesis glycosyltransferase [Terriglobia bacterium]